MAKNNGRKWAISAVFAGLVGFVAGILTAPKSGRETREDIKNVTTSAVREAEVKLKAVHTEIQELSDKVSGLVKDTSGTAKKDLEQALVVAKKAEVKVKEILSAIHDGSADDPELKAALKEANAAKQHLAKFLKAKLK